MDAINTFMGCAAWHPGAPVLFRASDMILRTESGGAHLAAPKSRSRAGGYHYLGNKHGDMFSAPFRALTKVLKHAAASTEEAEQQLVEYGILTNDHFVDLVAYLGRFFDDRFCIH